ncbi:hypothetical protein I6F14_18890 [Bradyrhizobium sp. IC3069]|uniref:FlaG protein n=1 Tax=Bradyrhizobium yuanmingense TaxID=108015 RepID=A0A0R3BTC9_9BRAD|nr:MULTISPECIES: hypothetical protein [Bradyrhizobium]KRP86235.1 hypothetical protein AOQ72_03310 [Bradyrhizobium yuanmingense]MCA1362374.1 hypothetical protein [Bradyrhizobium sp. IC4059]MCA1378122.1 hypothetical protein [Bradyrhizobium sp. IC4060]MCA1413208.1 hypothetical protein [Bradyrhizobium sp. NBAIM20]MCA1428165.1 hypothetical protein [Bradyrhizobium sp. NBAIM16]
MSTDFSIRPVGIPAPVQIVPTSNSAANEAVQTDLPVRQTVAASDTSAPVRNDLPNHENISRQVVFDQAAASFVFQVVNDKTDTVVNQFPDEAMLRRRAYFHALDMKSEPSRPLSTDLSA